MIRRLPQRVLWLLATLLLGACQSGPVDPETYRHYNIPTGSSVTLHAPIDIPPGTATIHIQDGAVKPYRDIRRYYPHCSLETKKLVHDAVQTIQPDVFTIHRSYFDEMIGAIHSPFLLARRISDRDGGGPTYIDMQRVMYLRSNQQPDVYRLNCRQWAAGPIYEHLTVGEVRQTLGKLMSLQLATPAI